MTTGRNIVTESPACANCEQRPGTLIWGGERDSVSLARNPPTTMWCEPCVACAQLDYARKIAATIPELEQRTMRLGGCKRCGKPLAYAGAVYCGAGCSARAEAGE